jgi:hypothetical protein
MSIWMWILVGVIGLVVLLILLFVVASILFQVRGRSDERKLAADPDHISRLAGEGNIAELLKALNSPSDKVSAEAARVLGQLKDPTTIPALTYHYFGFGRAEREPYAVALAAMPGEEIVPLLLKSLDTRNHELAIDLLRRFDRPEAREAVAKFDKQRAETEAEAARRNSIVERLLSDGAETARKTIALPLPIEKGGGVVASKIVGGMLTGGIMAAAPNKFTLDDFVSLPEECSFCGCLPGKKERWATCSFKLASAGWSVVGVNTIGEASLTYRVCRECSKRDEKAKAIQISIDNEKQGALTLNVNILNPDIARQVQDLNSDTPIAA